MPIVTVKKKYQVVIPRSIREEVGVSVGDLLEARADRGRITFSPKSLVDRAVAEGLEDLRRGRVYGPFHTTDELLVSLKGKRGKRTRKG